MLAIERYLRQFVTDLECGLCQDCIAHGDIVGLGVRYPRDYRARELSCEYVISIRCRQCRVLTSHAVPASREKWRACLEWLVFRGHPAVLGEGAEVDHITIAESEPEARQQEATRTSAVRPSVLPGTPTTPIGWHEQRAFLRQMSVNRKTNMFRRWMDRMENRRPKPPQGEVPPF